MTIPKTFPRMTTAYKYLIASSVSRTTDDILAISKELSEITIIYTPDLEQPVISEEPKYIGGDMYNEFTLRNLSRRALQLVAEEIRYRSGVGVNLNISNLALIRYIRKEQTDYYRMAKIKFAIKGANIWRHDKNFYANSLTLSTHRFGTAKAMYSWLEDNLGNLAE